MLMLTLLFLLVEIRIERTRQSSRSDHWQKEPPVRVLWEGGGLNMAQDQGRDRKLVSDEPYEVEYIHKQFPKHSHEQVVNALNECKKQLQGSESREKIMECLRGKLR